MPGRTERLTREYRVSESGDRIDHFGEGRGNISLERLLATPYTPMTLRQVAPAPQSFPERTDSDAAKSGHMFN
jgi:hypothetical protein